MIVNKYLSGLLAVLIVGITAFQAALVDGFTVTEAWQLAGLLVGVFVTTYVPLLEAGWAGALKVAGAVVGAGIAAVVPFVTGGWSMSAVVIVVLAVLNALAVQLGVNVRVDSARKIVNESDATPGGDTAQLYALQAVDPRAAAASTNIDKQRIA